MITGMLFRMAFRALCHHAVRSFLTLIGIVIGIAGIITIAAVGKGAQVKARNQYLAYGSNSIDISDYNWMSPSKKIPKALTLDDVSVIRALCPTVQYVSPVMFAHGITVERDGIESQSAIGSTNEYGLLITGRKLQQGSFFTQQQITLKENVVVISTEMAGRFFKATDPIGVTLRINKIPYNIIGILAPPKILGKWDGLQPEPAFIPFTTHQKYFGPRIRHLKLSTYTDEQVAEVTRQLEKILRAAHNLQEGEPNDFMIQDNQTMAAAAEEASKSVGLFSLIAAIIALLVGGIGVMNIMLVAVQERTKEIGIKSALGATMNFIRMQFLIEAIVICMVGGILGILFGLAAAFILNEWMGVKTIVEFTPIIISFFCTVLIGLIFGFYPAERAARLNPVEALMEY